VTGVRIVRADAMGAFTSNPSYYVDDKADDRRFTVGFSPNMFDGFEWGALKTFCNKRGITQTHLNLMFRRWCTYPNAYLAAYRVRLDDIKEYYLHSGTPAIIMELVGLFFPPCLLREYQALNPAYSHEQFSFARFVINSVIFCALPMPDLICALFSTIKQTAKAKRYFPADTPIPTVTFQHVVKVTTVCFAPYAARLLTAPALLPLNCRVCPPWGLQLLMDNLHGSCVRRYILTVLRNNAPKSADEEITVETIVRLGMKYVRALLLPMRFLHCHLLRVLARRGADLYPCVSFAAGLASYVYSSVSRAAGTPCCSTSYTASNSGCGKTSTATRSGSGGPTSSRVWRGGVRSTRPPRYGMLCAWCAVCCEVCVVRPVR
jgi:hypothetical protein